VDGESGESMSEDEVTGVGTGDRVTGRPRETGA